MGHLSGNHRAIEGTQDFLIYLITQANNVSRPSPFSHSFFELGPRTFARYKDINLCDVCPARVELIVFVPQVPSGG